MTLMRTLKLVIEYEGTELCGWQSQAGAEGQPTVQEALEASLSQVLDEPVKITGAGRTDAGVHARAQVAHLRTANPLEPDKILRGVNSSLRRDIGLREVREVPAHFDARRSALRRRYRYFLWTDPSPSPLRRRFTAWVRNRVDVEAMAAAARLFEGAHDFSAFRSTACTAPNPQRTVNRSRLVRCGPLLVYDVVARAFLHSQVRIMAGTLLEVGRGKLTPDDIRRVLERGDRSQAGPTAPPQGLVLWEIIYPPGM